MSSFLLEAIKAILWAVIGVFIGRYMTAALDRKEKIRKSEETKDILDKGSLIFKENKNVFALEHGNPVFNINQIEIKDTGKKLIVAIPAQFRDALREHDPAFVFRDQVSYNNSSSFSDLERLTKIPNLSDKIIEHSFKVGEDFIERQKNHLLLFNGEKFGVYDLFRGRVGKEEHTHLKIQLYQTDYFTRQVFASIYQELKENGHPISKVCKIEELKNEEIDYTPFLCSFGLCTFVLLYDERTVVLGERSEYIAGKERKYHFSMNEGFSQTDIDYQNKPSLYECLYRGLFEELHIKKELIHNTKPQFLDLIFVRDKFEIGITSVISLKDISFHKLKNDYLSAPDSSVETHKIVSVDLDEKSIKEFLAHNEMTAIAELALKLFYTRHSNNLINYN